MKQTFLVLLLVLLGQLAIVYPSHFPSTLTNGEWETIAPYIIPDSHPIKPALDKIFLNERPIRSIDSLQKAGFKIITKGHWSDTIIALHDSAPGFYFKMFTEEQFHINEISRLIARIKGAIVAESIVNKYNWHKIFKVPRKWLYLLPDDPSPIFGLPPKRMVLIAEDMRILQKNDNYRKWKEANLSKHLLDALFILLTEGGFSDSAFAFNLPFAKDGRVAIIDNDKYHRWPVPCHKFLKYLHPQAKKHWKRLIEKAGPAVAY